MTAKQFRDALERLDLTQGQAAEALNVSIRSINAWANGQKIPFLIAEVLTLWLKHGR